MTSAGGKLLEGVQLFDVYRDEERIGAGKKSMAYLPTYRAAGPYAYKRGSGQGFHRLVKKVSTLLEPSSALSRRLDFRAETRPRLRDVK